jgi:hypothetical protein
MRVAYNRAQEKFGNVTGGAHAVSEDVMFELIAAMNMSTGAVTWEIGCGLPALAAAISAVTAQDVLCTDVEKTYEYLLNVATTEMGLRELEANRKCFHATNQLSVEELSGLLNKKGEYVPSGPKLLQVLKAKYAEDAELQAITSLRKVSKKKTPVSGAKRARLLRASKTQDTRSPDTPTLFPADLQISGEARTHDRREAGVQRNPRCIQYDDFEVSEDEGEGLGLGPPGPSMGITSTFRD